MKDGQFRNIIKICEGRVDDSDAVYKSDTKKGTVKVSLGGDISRKFTMISKKLDEIDELKKQIKILEKETNAKEEVASLFDATEEALVRIVETKSIYLKLGKKEEKTTQETDYVQIVEELDRVLAPELKAILTQIKKQFTVEVKKTREPILTRGEVLSESSTGESAEVKALVLHIDRWTSSFDKKLTNIKKMMRSLE